MNKDFMNSSNIRELLSNDNNEKIVDIDKEFFTDATINFSQIYQSLIPEDFIDINYQQLYVLNRLFKNYEKHFKFNPVIVSLLMGKIRNGVEDFNDFINFLDKIIKSNIILHSSINHEELSSFCAQYTSENDWYKDVPLDIAMRLVFEIGEDFDVF